MLSWSPWPPVPSASVHVGRCGSSGSLPRSEERIPVAHANPVRPAGAARACRSTDRYPGRPAAPTPRPSVCLPASAGDLKAIADANAERTTLDRVVARCGAVLVEAHVVIQTAWCTSCEVPLRSSPVTLTGI